MTAPDPGQWGNWDVRHHTAVVHPGSGLRLRGAIGCDGGHLADGFTWRHGLRDVGARTADSDYAAFTVGCTGSCGSDTSLALEYGRTARGELVASLALRGDAAAHHDLVLVVDAMPGLPGGAVGAAGDGVDGLDVRLGAEAWRLAWSELGDVTTSDDATLVRIPGERAGEVRLVLAPSGDRPDDGPDAAAELKALADLADAAELRSSGWLGDSAAGFVRALTWNRIYAPDLGRLITPCSRDFVSAERDGFYGTWALHAWDSLFAGLTAAWIDPGYARETFGQIFEQATPAGFLPNRVSDERGRTDDRSQPPIGAYTVLKAYWSTGLSDETRDRRLVDDDAYATLTRWHDWWPRARRGPHGLLAWGSDPTDDPTSASIDNTRRESGLDDSPMYDEIGYDPVTHTMDLADVALNSLHAADAEALAAIARLRGDDATAARLDAEARTERAAIDDVLWDDERGHYANRLADGSFSIHVAPTYLYPLLAGVPSPERAARLVEVLMRPEVIGGSPPLPSIARNDPGFTRHYCRGRLWGPVALLAYEGFRRYGLDDWCGRIAHDLIPLFRHEWETHRHVHENYPLSLDEDIHSPEERSDFLHTWGNLMAYVPMLELADPRADGWRFAHPGSDAMLERIPVGEGRLSVSAGDRLVVRLDGAVLVDAHPAVVVSGYQRTSSAVSATVVARAPWVDVRFAVPAGVGAVRVTAGGETTVAPPPPDGLLRFPLPQPGVARSVRIETVPA